MTANYDKLIAVLKEVFMLDKAELDFGIYRIMNQKRADITQFLERDLVPQLQTILAQNGSGDRKSLEKQLEDAIKSVQSLGLDPETVPKIKELRAQLADIPDLTALENDVFSGLATFFKRYFDNGDFISMRRYKRDVYAIPYEGEELKLHWANADQYYIKTAEYLKHYRFRLDDNHHISFDLLEASTEQNNNKAQGDKERRFALRHDRPPHTEGDTLHIYFTYEPTDKKRKQDDLLTEAFETLKSQIPADFLPLLALSPTEKNRTRTVLEKHLRDYTARNTFDYFIHKDLGGFLRRELDFYIKNEVLYLDDLDTTDDRIILAQLAKVRALRQIGEKVITFLAQLEDFQKRLWLKKKFVVDSQYCITLDRISETYYTEIAQSEAQANEWVRLFAIDQITADAVTLPYARPLTVAFLKQNPFLILDTAFFTEDFKLRLLTDLPDLDANTDGLLINSENFQALNLLQERYREQIKCVYIDPPYNTDGDGFPYKDTYRHSSWLSMLYDRVSYSKFLMTIDGVLFNAIDENEQANCEVVLDQVFGEENYVATLIWEGGRKNDSKFVSVSHEYMLSYMLDKSYATANKILWRVRKDGIDDIYKTEQVLRKEFGTDYQKITEELKLWYRKLPQDHPAKAHSHYSNVDKKGVYFPGDISWPGGGGPRYPVINPQTGKEVKIPSRGWVFPTSERMKEAIEQDIVHFGAGENSVPCFKRYLKETEFQSPNSVFYKDGRAATKDLRNILGDDLFGNPKDPEVLGYFLKASNTKDSHFLDYFAGSGTTGHAVINLNREDGGQRKYILVEMGEYFDTVTKPRILKVIYSKDWRDGKPVNRQGISHCLKYLRLESYEDTLNNLSLSRTAQQELALGESATFREGYLLRYMLDVESRQSLFDVGRFRNPFACYIDITRQNERTPTRVDLVETFNYLIGLVVEGQYTSGEHIRVVTGQTLKGEKSLIIWRNQDEVDNAALNDWLTKSGYNPRDREFDRIYVNGDNHLENLRRDDESWKVTLIEEEFRVRMG